MANCKITIQREKLGVGTLTYSGNKLQASYKCWWDLDDEIPASIYTGCSKTYLAGKKNSSGGKREGIFIPDVEGRKGIFIHYWPGPGANIRIWSDGCTCVLENDMLAMWKDIQPMDGRNVTVEILAPCNTPRFQTDMCRSGVRR